MLIVLLMSSGLFNACKDVVYSGKIIAKQNNKIYLDTNNDKLADASMYFKPEYEDEQSVYDFSQLGDSLKWESILPGPDFQASSVTNTPNPRTVNIKTYNDHPYWDWFRYISEQRKILKLREEIKTK